MTPTLAHCVWPLPPKGAAAPADWQSQIRGPGLKRGHRLGELVLIPRPLEACKQVGRRP